MPRNTINGGWYYDDTVTLQYVLWYAQFEVPNWYLLTALLHYIWNFLYASFVADNFFFINNCNQQYSMQYNSWLLYALLKFTIEKFYMHYCSCWILYSLYLYFLKKHKKKLNASRSVLPHNALRHLTQCLLDYYFLQLELLELLVSELQELELQVQLESHS